ncbi:glutathione S-transferase family protein [Sphingomonas morindae]|uniref:Glutathione S-transferase family protein n=1 Tax=Sphingomonas morindae TaxID=1541170 RepID=A0ABY4XCL8_9SPHN|nr:glutathione S-transferase family protein [Sphingomonas morindae]USI74701.1 glutathione S-transferase family protein [Sphingomonas morindae]
MAIQVYGDPGSGSLRRVITAASIMGIELERVPVDLFKGESQTSDFKSRFNPHGLTPVMVDGDTILYESSAINIYLAEKVGSDLLGTTPAERYQVLQWMFWSGEQWRVFATLVFDERIGKRFVGQAEDARIVELAFGKIHAAAAVLDAHLADRRFIAGDRLTLADLDIAGPFSQSARTKLPLTDYPNLVAWQQRLLDTVPAWAETKREVDARIDGALAGAGIVL